MARRLAACRLANGASVLSRWYWPTLTVNGSPPVGRRTSKKRASAGTLPNGRCTDSAGCASPQRQADTSRPCCAAILSSARSSACALTASQPSSPHQKRSLRSRMPSTASRNRRLPYRRSKRSRPRRSPTTWRVNSSAQTLKMSGAAASARISPSKPSSAASAAGASGWLDRACCRKGSRRTVAADRTSAWMARKLSTVCLGVWVSNSSMRS